MDPGSRAFGRSAGMTMDRIIATGRHPRAPDVKAIRGTRRRNAPRFPPAEDLCQLFHRNHGLACIVLRTSRFFLEEDDSRVTRDTYADDNAKANEFLFRRVDLEDAVSAHVLAGKRAPAVRSAL
jgi:hypothetical protein